MAANDLVTNHETREIHESPMFGLAVSCIGCICAGLWRFACPSVSQQHKTLIARQCYERIPNTIPNWFIEWSSPKHSQLLKPWFGGGTLVHLRIFFLITCEIYALARVSHESNPHGVINANAANSICI